MDQSQISSKHTHVINPLLTDYYQISMAYSYFKAGLHEQHSVFEMFFRKNPFKGEYTIFGGLSEVILFLQNYKFEDSHIEYIQQLLGNNDKDFFDYLKNLDTSKLKLYAAQEGQIIFPSQPIITLEGPIILVQLLETTILCLCNFASLIATNASRMRLAAGNNVFLSEFGLRRAQGPDGGLSASQYAYLGGFDSTSNVLAGYNFNIPVSGSVAHSFITSFNDLQQVQLYKLNDQILLDVVLKYRSELNFQSTNDGELAAFIAYAFCNPKKFIALVDTFNVLKSGVPNFIIVSLALLELGYQPIGFRLDSGDLAQLSKDSKKLIKENFDKYKRDSSQIKIIASNDINEEAIKDMNKKGHDINIFGIGTHLVTCQKQPALGMVYKLVQSENTGKMKFSEDITKTTLPGKKTTFRIFTRDIEYPSLDVICCYDEEIQIDQEFPIRQVSKIQQKFSVKPTKVEKLVNLLWDGKLIGELDDLKTSRNRVLQILQTFDPSVLDLDNPKKYRVFVSEKLAEKLLAAIDKATITELIE